jgi:acyl transferase domain-containing protein
VLFVLKRFQDAVLDNDRILGIIRGVEVNQTHLNSSIIRTHSPTQAALLGRLLRSTKVQPGDVDVIEAHAAGTKQGDTTELLAIRDVFLKGDQPRRPLYVTSIKAFIGHSEAASGAGSLAKVLLMLHHETIPRQIAIRTLNPAGVDISALSIPTETTAWKQQAGKPRCAVVNNYGASGANASILVEEYLHPCGDAEPRGWDVSSMVFGMSAPNRQALEELKEKWLVWLNDPSNEASVSDICYSSTARRQQHEYRLSFATPDDRQEFASRLLAAPVVKVDSRQLNIVFVFAGHGSQNPGMGAVLYEDCAVFKIYIDTCNDILVKAGFPTIMPYLLDGSNPPSDEASVVEHTALLSFEVALSMMWKSWGVSPSAVIGHRCVLSSEVNRLGN